MSASVAYNLLDAKGQRYYNPNRTERYPLLPAVDSIPSLEDMNSEHKSNWFTYSPNHISHAIPNRTIDYLFYTDELTVVEKAVRSEDTLMISDHLPVVGVFVLP